MRFAFSVIGRPQPAGSKRAFRHPSTGRIIVTDASAKSKPWKQEVAETARGVLRERHGIDAGPPFTGPVELVVTFYRQRPRGDYGTGRNSDVLKPGASAYPVSKPDTTKLLRGVEDALTSVLWRDDAQVVDQHVYKRYGTPERAEIEVRAKHVTVGSLEAATSEEAA